MPVDLGEFVDPQSLRSAFMQGLRPDPIQSIAEWADEHRRLSKEASSEPGRWRTSRTPYLREIMESLSPASVVERVVFVAGAQIGKTETGNNFVAYVIAKGLGPMLVIQKTDQLAKRYSKQRLAPLVRDTPALHGKIRDKRSRDAGNTLLHKEFPGGQLIIANAEAAAMLRSMPIRFLFMDEVDSYPIDTDGEGDPCDLAIRRTATFRRRKVFTTSTPTLEGVSRIMAQFEQTDRRYFHVPCPDCDTFQRLEWQRLKFDRDAAGYLVPGTTRYACSHCGVLLEEWQRTAMLERGEWRAANPLATERVRGYHLSALYSPVGMYSWEDAASEWCEARRTKSQQKLKVFVNTVLGETWKEAGDAPEWQVLYRRRESYKPGTVPKGGVVLTAGADVQRDRIEVEVVAWGQRLENWSVDYQVLEGDPSEDAVWRKLEAVIAKAYPVEGGGERRLRLTAIDAGDQKALVSEWVRRQDQTRVIAIQGREIDRPIAPPTKVDVTIRGKRRVRRGMSVWSVGSGWIKGELYGWLRAKPPLERDGEFPAGWSHWPDAYPADYFKQLTAEHLVTEKDPRGFPKRKWKKVRERNEALDCRVYARAASVVVGVDRWTPERWDEEAAAFDSPRATGTPKPKAGGYLRGGNTQWQLRGPKRK